jgi:hypothetical protein
MHLWDEHKRTDQGRENGGVEATYYSTELGETRGWRTLTLTDLVKAWDETKRSKKAKGLTGKLWTPPTGMNDWCDELSRRLSPCTVSSVISGEQGERTG